MKIEFITAHYYSYYSKTSILEYQLVSSNRIPKSRSPFWEKFMKNAPRNSFYIVLKPQFFWKFEKFFNKKKGKKFPTKCHNSKWPFRNSRRLWTGHRVCQRVKSTIENSLKPLYFLGRTANQGFFARILEKDKFSTLTW